MNCKECRHWFVNPNIVIPGEPTEGKCLVSEIKTQSNQVCNAWELSQIAEWKDDNEKLTARIAELERDKKALRGIEENLREHIDIGTLQLSAATARIVELEGKFDQLTAHDATERQDDKSPNNTQTQTFVYGKESEE